VSSRGWQVFPRFKVFSTAHAVRWSRWKPTTSVRPIDESGEWIEVAWRLMDRIGVKFHSRRRTLIGDRYQEAVSNQTWISGFIVPMYSRSFNYPPKVRGDKSMVIANLIGPLALSYS